MKTADTDLSGNIPLNGLTRSEQDLVEATVAHTMGDPLRALERKIQMLARLLDCSEEEATHLFLHSL